MKMSTYRLLTVATASAVGAFATPLPAAADPSLECSMTLTSQVEISDCVGQLVVVVDQTIEQAFGFAMSAASELDGVTERDVAVPALTASQDAWSAFRIAQCAFVGASFGGGSGAGIAEGGCRITLGRARVAELMAMAR